DLGLNTIEDGDVVLGHAAVATQQAAMRIRTDNRNRLEAADIERDGIAFVPEQGDGFTSGAESEFAMGLRTHYAVGFIRIDVWIVKEAHFEFPKKHGGDEFVELGFLQHALADKFNQVEVAIRVRQFDIDAGLNRQGGRLFFVLGDEVAVGIGTITQFPNREVIGNDEAFEAPFPAENVLEKPLIGVRGN